uniref:Uncharacterized protein n=1 Tax=Panagrolaimus davidi TaxID=227884 RepID=A0A914QRP5_9BILA
MILSKEFYDKCCPSYQKVIDELEKKIAEIEKSDDATKGEKVNLAIYQFSKRYLTPGEYWGHCLNYIELYNPKKVFDTFLRMDIIGHAYYHLYLNKRWADRFYWGSNYLKLDYFRSDFYWRYNTIYEHDLYYPHEHLKFCLRKFEQQTTKLPSKDLYKRCEEMMLLYPKIKAAFGDIDEWFQLLLKVNDVKYLKHNVEYRIGQNLHDVKLWKIYINYLKQNDQYKYLLGTYSKYCRFFLDDDEMKKEYQKAMLEHGPVHLPWENLLEFEKGCGMKEVEDQYSTPEEEDDTQSSDEEDLLPFDKSLCRRFYDTYKVQEFALPRPIILYVLENAGHRVLRKLFASCKYFFKKQPTPICHRLQTGPREIYRRYRLRTDPCDFYVDESLTLKRHSKEESFPKNIYITGNMFCGKHYAPLIDFLPKFYRCEAKFIRIPSGIHLSFDELKFLIGHGGVVELNIHSCILKDEKNECIALEKIMEFLPNIEQLYLNNVKITEKTPHALTSMKFYSKFYEIYIDSISGEPFDTEEFLRFLIVNKMEPYEHFNCVFIFCKEFNSEIQFLRTFKKLLKGCSTFVEESCGVEVFFDGDDVDSEEESGDELETDSNDSD